MVLTEITFLRKKNLFGTILISKIIEDADGDEEVTVTPIEIMNAFSELWNPDILTRENPLLLRVQKKFDK